MPTDPLHLPCQQLEEALVRQFRLLQEFYALSQKERQALLHNPDQTLRLVEEKEALLDGMSLLEDKNRRLTQEISLTLRLPGEETSLQAILPHLPPTQADRLRNLSQGITSLASQAKELNRANHALALSRLEWLQATQTFLVSIFQPAGYPDPKQAARHQNAPGLGVEFKA